MAAEAILSSVVQSLATLLFEKTISFSTSFTGVHDKLEHLQKEFESIQGFLSTADLNHNQDPDIRIWVSDVRDIAYDVDDVIDSFLHKVAYNQEGESSSKRYVHKPKKFLNCYKLNKKMENLLSKLKEISERRRRYDGITTQRIVPSNTRNTNGRLLRRVYSHIPDDVTIGLEEQTNELVTKLLQEEDRVCVVSICGMGGLGKTTLAKKIYNHHRVKSHFVCYAWTSISQQMRTKEVLKEIIRKVNNQANNNISDMSEAELVRELFQFLDGRRYLVVLDDIWSTKDWDVIKPAFPNSKGSKIMVTTRNKQVVEHADRWSCHHEPRSLTNKEAWELLCKKAFPRNDMDSSCPLSSEMEKCGRDMVKKCGGLPLEIVVLSGLLASKSSLNEWETLSKQIGTVGMGSGKDDEVLSILSLSYHELPYKLKPLFLYLGLFPEDFDIPVKKLIHMWMEERLIPKEEGTTIEEVGRQYLEELINRCMVQIGRISQVTGKAKTCRVHDKMRDLCIDIGKKENFFDVVRHQNNDSASSSSSPCSKLRRCTIYIEEKGNQYVFPNHLIPCLRTVFFIPNGSFNYCLVYKHFKLLKVLVFHGDLIVGKEVSGVLYKLCNLRYLDLGRFTEYCMDNELPQLKHLYGDITIRSKIISKMTELQSLKYVCAGPWIQYLVTLTNLQKLWIDRLDEETIGMFTIVINSLDKLRSLSLYTVEGCNFSSELLEALFDNRHLLKLRLVGEINNGKLPSHVTSNLIKLILVNSNLSDNPMPTLEKLQHLLYLRLDYSYSGKQMVGSTKGFPQLCFLRIAEFDYLEEWTMEKGAMPCLKTCEISGCNNLKMVPQGFKFLDMIQELTIRRMPKSFEERVKEGGEDWETIKHVPSIIVTRKYYRRACSATGPKCIS